MSAPEAADRRWTEIAGVPSKTVGHSQTGELNKRPCAARKTPPLRQTSAFHTDGAVGLETGFAAGDPAAVRLEALPVATSLSFVLMASICPCLIMAHIAIKSASAIDQSVQYPMTFMVSTANDCPRLL